MSVNLSDSLRQRWQELTPEEKPIFLRVLRASQSTEIATDNRPRNDHQLKQYLLTEYNIVIPDTQVCPNHVTPFRAFSDAYFARYNVTVWEGSRGFAGKSYLLALLGHIEADTLGAEVTILGGSGEQSTRVIEYLQKWSSGEENIQRRTRYRSGGLVTALMASSKSARGPHPQRMRLDEVDEMELAILDAAMGQPMGTDKVAKQTVMSSTHHYADGTFTEIKKRADEKGWPVQEWCLDGDSAILTPNGETRIKALQVGDLVYSHQQGTIRTTTVTNAWCSGIRQTIVINTDADSLKCTPEHRILTPSGWMQAGDLRAGDSVCSVWQEQTEVRREPLPQVSQRQEVRGLWQGNHQGSNPLQWLLRQAAWTVSSTTCGQVNLSVVQGVQASYIAGVFDLLSPGTKQAQYKTGWRNGVSSSANSLLWQFSTTPKCGRDSLRGNSTKAINKFSQTTVIRALRGGFRAARLWLSGRSKWPLLAFQRGADRTRQTQGSSSPQSEAKTIGALDGPAPSLDLSTVRSIEYGDVVRVYDITVEEGESFIANGIVVHNCYRETSAKPDGWLTQEEIESKRGEVTASMWAAEYDLQEPSPEGRAILPESVDACFRDEFNGRLTPQELLGPMGYELIIEEPVPGATYATGGDWAKKKDYTVIDTFRTDVRPMRRVAWARYQRMSWPMMIAKFDARVAKYPGPACHDATGLGDVVDDYQEADARGVVLAGQTRADVFTKYIAAIEDRAIVSAKIKYCEGEHRYCTNEDLAAGTKGHPPDSFVAGAMAYRAASTKEMQFF